MITIESLNRSLQDFKNAVATNSVVEFNAEVLRFLENAPGDWDQKKNDLSVLLVRLQGAFHSVSAKEQTRYKNLRFQWLQSDIIDRDLLDDLFVNTQYPVWKYLLEHTDTPEHFSHIDVGRLFHPTGQSCLQAQTVDFLSQLIDNYSVICFEYFLQHDFVVAAFSSLPANESLNWQVTSPNFSSFWDPLWNFYANQLHIIQPTWILGLIDAAQEREDGEILQKIFTDPRFQTWIETSTVFHQALLERPWFSMDLYPSLLEWLPTSHHFAVRRSVVVNENFRIRPNDPLSVAFIASLPDIERIEHFVGAWNWLAEHNFLPETLQRKYVVPALECFSAEDIDCLLQHPWMEHATDVVWRHPKIQNRVINTALRSGRSHYSGARTKKI